MKLETHLQEESHSSSSTTGPTQSLRRGLLPSGHALPANEWCNNICLFHQRGLYFIRREKRNHIYLGKLIPIGTNDKASASALDPSNWYFPAWEGDIGPLQERARLSVSENKTITTRAAKISHTAQRKEAIFDIEVDNNLSTLCDCCFSKCAEKAMKIESIFPSFFFLSTKFVVSFDENRGNRL